jgi:CheY-like chemotaxis protein/biotin operon repressor
MRGRGLISFDFKEVAALVADGGRLLLILTSRAVQSAAELAATSGLAPTEVVRQLQQLTEEGFIVAADDAGVRVYQLSPKRGQPTEPDLPQRILLVENELILREMMVTLLEAEGYAVIACAAPLAATTLLERVTFDLVITDGFSHQASGVFANTADVLHSAGVTPVALFSAHTLELDAAQAAGFRDLITKPFDMDTLVRQIRLLLGH